LAVIFEQSIRENEIPAVIKGVFRVAPYKLWKHRWLEFADQEKLNPFLTDYFDSQYSMERSFEVAYDYYRSRRRIPQIDEYGYELFLFFALLVKVHERLSRRGQVRLEGSVRDALQSTAGLVPVELELRVATHLMRNGFEVDFTDLEQNQQFDLFASKSGMEIEIDCKSLSADVGRRIHSRRFREFAGRLNPLLRELVRCGGGSLVQIVILESLHGDSQELASETKSAIRAAIGGGPPIIRSALICKASIRSFDLQQSPFDRQSVVSGADLSTFITKQLGLDENLNVLSHYVPHVGAVIVVMQSDKPDTVIDGLYRQLRDSARRQFSGHRPAVLCVRLRDLSARQLIALASERVNGLAAIATRLFAADDRSHLAGISYLSPSGELTRSVANSIQDVGTAYYFPNPKNRSEAVEQIFTA
jgi:hypothetical protein